MCPVWDGKGSPARHALPSIGRGCKQGDGRSEGVVDCCGTEVRKDFIVAILRNEKHHGRHFVHLFTKSIEHFENVHIERAKSMQR